MGAAARVAKNTVAFAAGNLLAKFLSLVFFVYIARRLGDVSFGRFSTAMALVGLFEIVPNYLSRPYLIREIARTPERVGDIVAHAVWVNIALSLALFGGLTLAAPHFGYHPDTVRAIALLAFALVFDALTNTTHAVLAGFERMELSAALNIGNTVVTVALGGGALALGFGLTPLILAYVTAKALTLIFAFRLLRKLAAQPALTFNAARLAAMLQAAWPFFVTTVFVMIYARLDVVMLSFFRGEEDVGYYNAAYKVMEGMGMVTASFVYAVYPVLARAFVDRPDRLVIVYRQALRYLLTFVLPAAAGLALLANDLMPTLFGASFGPAALALAILAWGQALDSINPLLTQTLRAADRERRAAWNAAVGAGINVAVNLALIPLFGLTGAAVATVLAFAALLWLNLRALHQEVGAAHIRGPFARTAGATVAMAAAVWWLMHGPAADWAAGWRLAAAGGVGATVYAAAALALGVLHADDRQLLLGIFRRGQKAPKGAD